MVADAKVFVVVPVFERLTHTRECIAQLRQQTYPNIEIVIVDGGSRDGSVDELRRCDGITLIADVGEQWWTGATWFGIDHALRNGTDDDYVMLLNNDTTFPEDMISVLISESRRLDAVVAPIAVAADGSVVNSGVWIDWSTYAITQRMGDAGLPLSSWSVDAMEGRGTLIPLRMVRRAGNVAKSTLPHYAADYEFTLRLARCGFPLRMTNRTTITVDWGASRMAQYWQRATFARLWWELTDRRSFINLGDHFTLIDAAGPTRGRRTLKVRLVARRLMWAARRSKARELPGVDTAILTVRWIARRGSLRPEDRRE
ncbi:MAG TPA: glycosyltransferase [Acidimicrobiales bacterium]|nr:glycosyltransferase [Acidimicrobiales bacterium]